MNGIDLVKASQTTTTGNRVTAKQIREMVDRQGYRCKLTGWKLTPEVSEADHIIPVSRGGKNSIDNLQIVHRLANASKRNMSQEEFVSLCCAVSETMAGYRPSET